MPVVSADTLQLSMIEEVTPGVTPSTPAFLLWRTSGEGVTFTPNTSESTELASGGRSAFPANVTGVSVAGDINFELSWFDALKKAISSVLASPWGECPIGGAFDADRATVGQTPITFTIEKRFPNPNHVTGGIGAMTAVPTGAPGPSVTLTFAGGPSVGTGIVETRWVVDGGQEIRVDVPIAAADTNQTVAATATALIDAEDELAATDNLDGTVTVTTTGTQIDSATANIGVDEYYYQWYRGCTFSTLTLTTAPNEPVTGSVGVVGGVPDLGQLPISGSTYVQAANSAVFTAPQVLALEAGTVLGINSHCWTSMDLTLDSQNRAISCIGFAGEREVVLGTLTCTLSGDVYFTDQELLELILTNQNAGDGYVTLSNADGEILRFDLYDLKPTGGELTAGGTGEDLTIPAELQPTPVDVCDDGGTGRWKASLIVSTVNTAPTLPA